MGLSQIAADAADRVAFVASLPGLNFRGLLSHAGPAYHAGSDIELEYIATREQDGRVEVTTTDIHIARRLGDALLDAFQGELHVSYSPGDYFVRVSWSR